ncbi:hypothetical protein Dip518_001368 [Parelusimicrobium proximum]|uniref:alpha-2-macroglobulin n=1 Tax=Parelusimicrobium proximum TaxID=3228953 RepID=UPI003D167A97
MSEDNKKTVEETSKDSSKSTEKKPSIFTRLFTKLKDSFKKNPFTGVIISLCTLVFIGSLVTVGVFCAKSYQLRKYNEVRRVNFSLSDIRPTSVYTDSSGKSTLGTPNNLYVYFYEGVSFDSEKEQKALEKITITPEVKGAWKWQSSSRLVFTPEKDWPMNQKYTVKFPQDIVGANTSEQLIKLTKYEFTFNTPAFNINLNGPRLYQDPENPKIYTVLGEFDFSHSVVPADFEKALGLKLDKKKLDFSVVYDDFKRKATIKSEPVNIKEDPQLAVLTVGKMHGSQAIDKTLDIPSSSKFFRIDGVRSQIVRNDLDEPEQILFVNFTDSIAVKDLNNKVEAYALPLKNPNRSKRKKAEQICEEVEEEDCDNCEYDEETGEEYDCYCETRTVQRCYDSSDSGYSSYDMWIPSDITPEVLKTLKKVKLTAVPAAEDHAKTHSYKYSVNTDTNEKIFVRISAPLTSRSGFEIKRDNDFVITASTFPKELKIAGDGSLLAMSGSKKISFVSRGIDGIKVELARVLPGRINHLVSQTYGSFQRPYFQSSYYFNENDISENFTQTIPLVKSNQKANYSSVDLSSYITPSKTGLFFVKSYGYNPKNNSSQTSTQSRFILVTNLGLLTKKDIDGNTRVYVMSVNSGSPVAGAKVEVLGRNGVALFTKYTNDTGYADFPTLKDFRKEKEPVAYVATLGTDVSFIPVDRSDRRVNYSRFETEGLYYSSYKEKGLTAFLFSDRGLYRPGESISIASIVKTPSWSQVGGIPVRFVMNDPKGKKIFEKTISLPSEGFSDFAIHTLPTYVTGTYYAYLYDITDKKRPVQLGSTTIRLEEFQEDKLRIKAKILGGGKKGWQPMEGLSAKINLENLYGTPAQGNRILANLNLTPITFRFSAFKGYTFQDPNSRKNASQIRSATISLIDDVTDKNGEITKEIDLSAYSGGAYRLTLGADGYEQESGASVYGTDALWVSPSRYLVGYKSASNLGYLKRNSEASIEFIAVDSDLNKIAKNKLTAKVIMQQYVSTLVKQYNGTYKYQSVLKEETKSEKSFDIKAAGSKYVLDTSSPGSYVLEISDEFNEKVSRVEFTVAGSANLTYSLEKDAELKLSLESTEVAPGEDLTINIIAPYTGAGLITIEREKVFAQKWFKTTTTSSQQTIRVPSDFEGNGYINVSFVRGIDSDDVFSSPHSYAVIPFYVKRDKRTVKITLDTPEVVKPGDTLEVKYKASQNSKIVVYGVSEGIIQVAKYQLPSPLNFFFKKLALEVKTSQIVDLILPDFKMVQRLSATGGGGYDYEEDMAMKMLAANLNPFSRKREAPVVFWSGIIDAGTDERTYSYKVPSYFNGEIKVMAVAANAGSAGAASTSVQVRAPIILMTGHPFMAVPGDTFDVSVRAANNIADSKDGKITINMSASEHLQIIGDSKKELDVPYGSEKTVSFKAKALDKLGGAVITFLAEHNSSKEYVKAEATLSVRPETAYRTDLTTGVITKKSAEVDGFERDMFDFAAERTLFVSNSPLILAKGLGKFFSKYPHGCSEQITSQVYPFLALAPLTGKGILNRADVEESFDKVISKLRIRQLNGGGFTMWDGSGYETKDITIYVMNFLIDAKDMSYNVPSEMLEQGLSRLDDYASKYPASEYEAKLAAYSAYLLAREGKVVTNYLLRTEEYLNKNVKDWQKTMTGAYIASAYKLLKDDKKADDLIGQYKMDTPKYTYYSDYDSSAIRNANFIYLVGKHFPDRIKKVSDSIMPLVENIVNNNYNTMSAAATIKALTAYSEAVEGKDDKIKIYEKVKGNKKFEELKVSKDELYPSFDFSKDAEEFKLEGKGGPLGLFYIISTQGFDKKAPSASKAKGLELVREYIDSNGKAVSTANIGDELTVRIKIRVTGKKDSVDNIAIVDLMPGAFETISGSVKGSLDFSDLREDRALLYLSANKSIKEISYKVKVIASGEYAIPMSYAVSLYDTDTSGYSKGGKFTVKPRQ